MFEKERLDVEAGRYDKVKKRMEGKILKNVIICAFYGFFLYYNELFYPEVSEK